MVELNVNAARSGAISRNRSPSTRRSKIRRTSTSPTSSRTPSAKLPKTEIFGAVAALLSAGRHAEGAEQFVEQVALGPGQWALLPPPVQQTFTTNAETWLDETKDPEALTLDVGSLANFSGPALLTQGTESPPFFGLILDKIAPALHAAQRLTLDGAGA